MRSTLLVAVLLLATSCSSQPAAPEDPILATVGGEVITAGQLEQRILDRYYGRLSLLGMVRAALFRLEAERLGLVVTEEEIQAAIQNEIERMIGPGDEEAQLAALQRRGLRLDDLQRNLRPEAESWLLMSKVARARRSTEANLQRFYEETYEEDRVFVRHIAFPFVGKDEPTNEQVQELEGRAKEVRSLLADGADFAQLAARLSGNRDTARRGGEIGWLQPDTLDNRDMSRQIFALGEGQVSDPIREGSYGWHLFKVEKFSGKRPLVEVREELLEELRTAEPTPEELSALEEVLRREHPVVIYEEGFE